MRDCFVFARIACLPAANGSGYRSSSLVHPRQIPEPIRIGPYCPLHKRQNLLHFLPISRESIVT
jgi:hypothetical protein